jgi:hypothetical protein
MYPKVKRRMSEEKMGNSSICMLLGKGGFFRRARVC